MAVNVTIGLVARVSHLLPLELDVLDQVSLVFVSHMGLW